MVKLLEIIKNFEGAGRNDLRAFLEVTRRRRGGELRLDDRRPSDIPAVKVMSIHKAKGLGFPVVILLLYGEAWQPPGLLSPAEEDGVRVVQDQRRPGRGRSASSRPSTHETEGPGHGQPDEHSVRGADPGPGRALCHRREGPRDKYPFDLLVGRRELPLLVRGDSPPRRPAPRTEGAPPGPRPATIRFRGRLRTSRPTRGSP